MPGKFVVKKGSTGKFRFSLLSTNGQIVATSEAYNTKASAMGGIRSVKNLAADAEIEDQTTKEWAAGEADRKAAAAAKKAKSAGKKKAPRVQLLGSGTILREVEAAREMLSDEWGVNADVWSCPSFTELRRDGLEVERWNRLHPTEPPRRTWVEQCLEQHPGPVVAATDYIRQFPDMIRPWVDRPYRVLGTDGFGRSDWRVALRRFFEVDRHHVVVAALQSLVDAGQMEAGQVAEAIQRYGIDADVEAPWRR